MIEFRDTLTGLIDEYGQVEDDQFELPKPAVIGDKRTKQVIFFETHNFYDMINTCCIIFSSFWMPDKTSEESSCE